MYKRQLDGFRAILFFAVFTYHHNVNWWFLTYALPCFFVLSGFLITRILVAGDGRPRGPFLKSFYIRRALRILPLFYAFLAVAIAFDIIVYPIWHATYAFNIKLFLLSIPENRGAFLRLFAHWQHGQLHLWSLAVEEQFYLLWPGFVVFTPKRWRIPVVGVLIAASIALRMGFAHSETYALSLYGALLPVCGEYILWGSLAGLLQSQGFRFRIPAAWLYTGVLGLLVLSHLETPEMFHGFYQFIPSPRQTFFGISIALVIIGLWNDDDALLSRFLRFPVFTWLGKMSYGLYVVHMATWDLADWMVTRFPSLRWVNLYSLRLVLCILAASLSWYCLEGPINRLKRHFPTPRPRA